MFSLSWRPPVDNWPIVHDFCRATCRVPSVLFEGSPVSPPDRFVAVIARHHVTVLKAGSTFLRMLMTRSNARCCSSSTA